ncbi:hypothetical protein DJ568_08215 [Mucilaginibacter hurinus]|uniref:TPM domain-containing protein n=1 Tax=Mucilaginibacter hurinus TaxID=2201324 RepID=A0A367GR21_9SPHI|nr:TPM domain-containing protein [Mucilaginibacter hurinus]RCH55163.1 hypothetical protein DJ568_08215 [Mucilaginibacter hurinus]
MKRLFTILFVFIGLTAFSQIPKPLPDTYVNDFASLLNEDQIDSLNKKIHIIEKQSGVQLALVLVNEIPKDYEIEDYSLLIARKWGVGKNDDGLVYVAAINQRKQRMEVARDLEGKIPDIIAFEIMERLKPYFKNKNYYNGLNVLVDNIAQELSVDLGQLAMETYSNDEPPLPVVEWYDYVIAGIVLLVILTLFYGLIRFIKAVRKNIKVIENQRYMDLINRGRTFNAIPEQRYRERDYRPYDRQSDRPGRSYKTESSNGYKSDTSKYGNWGGNKGRDSQSNKGFSGGGATSDW